MTRKLLLALLLGCTVLPAQELGRDAVLMPKKRTGVEAFLDKYAGYDGRGVVVAVVDSGFDLGHPAFRTTTSGQPKVIDVRDFSDRLVVPMGPRLSPEGDTSSLPSVQGGRIELGDFQASAYRVGVLREELMADSPLPDLNRDTTQDEQGDPPPGVEPLRYPLDDRDELDVVLALVEDGAGRMVWECRIDLDNDGSVADETSMRDYKELRQLGYLDADRLVAFCLNVPESGEHVKIVLADSSHGSHVAGIIGGNDPEGIVGIAPGVQFIFIKVGYGRRRGASATSRASALAYRYACEQGADVLNYSYGGRPTPSDGQWFNARYIDELSRTFGTLFCISAGNEGPGLFTIGTPATSEEALTVGNFWVRDGASDMLGYTNLPGDVLIGSSSRGPVESGRLKPDLLAPGFAVNSVPMYGSGYSFMNGTSMASPHAAGCAALLVSGMRQAGAWPEADAASLAKNLARRQLKTAMIRSGRPLAQTLKIEQGGGVLHVPDAWKLLTTMRSSGRTMPPVIKVWTSGSLWREDGRAMESAVIRDGDREVTATAFQIEPVFEEDVTEAAKSSYLGQFRLECDADWLWATGGAPSGTGLGRDTSREAFWLGGHGGSITVAYDAASLKPGVHVGTISAYPLEDDVIGSQEPVPAFELVTTYIVPHKLDSFGARPLSVNVGVGALPIGGSYRAFVAVPHGGTALELTLSSRSPLAAVQATVISPYGDELGSTEIADDQPAHLNKPHRASNIIAVPEPGIYEIVFRRYFRSRAEVPFKFETRLLGVDLASGQNLEFPKGAKKIQPTLVNAFAGLNLTVEAQVTAWTRSREIVGAGAFVDIPVVALPGAGSVRVRFESQQAPVARAVGLFGEVFDSKGRLVTKGGSYRTSDVPPDEYDLSWNVSGSGRYTVRIHRMDHAALFGFHDTLGTRRPGWLHPAAELELQWTEMHQLSKAQALKLKPGRLDLDRYDTAELSIDAPAGPNGPFAVDGFFGTFSIETGGKLLQRRLLQGSLEASPEQAGGWLDGILEEMGTLATTRNARRRDLLEGHDPSLASDWFRDAARAYNSKLADADVLDQLGDLAWVAEGLVQLLEGNEENAKSVASLAALRDRAERLGAIWAVQNEPDADVAAAQKRRDQAVKGYEGWLSGLRAELAPGQRISYKDAIKALESEDAGEREAAAEALRAAWKHDSENGLRLLGVMIAEQRRMARARRVGPRNALSSMESWSVARGLDGDLAAEASRQVAAAVAGGFQQFLQDRGSEGASLSDLLAARSAEAEQDSLAVTAEELQQQLEQLARKFGFGPSLDSADLQLHVVLDEGLESSVRHGNVIRSWPEVPAADSLEMGRPQLDAWLRYGPDAEGSEILEGAAAMLAEALVTASLRPHSAEMRFTASVGLCETLFERKLKAELGLKTNEQAQAFLLGIDILRLGFMDRLERASRGPAALPLDRAQALWQETLASFGLGAAADDLLWQADSDFLTGTETAFDRVIEEYAALLGHNQLEMLGWDQASCNLVELFRAGPVSEYALLQAMLRELEKAAAPE